MEGERTGCVGGVEVGHMEEWTGSAQEKQRWCAKERASDGWGALEEERQHGCMRMRIGC